jgi:antirestriction protein ArdC
MTPEIQENVPTSTTESSKPKRDLRQEVTDQIIQALENGATPWQKPWKAGSLEMPFNPTTNNAYRGGNALHLMLSGQLKGYDDPRWLTYKQATENGWQVREGEKGTQIEYWEYRSRERPAAEISNTPGEKADDRPQRPIHRVYTVFNGQQVEGIPRHQPKEHPEWEVVQSAEQILENSGAKILHDRNDEAFYSRVNDRIHLPARAAFQSEAGYYGTALHELGHWTGHPDRLNRRTLTESYRFGDLNYAKEELRAELTSVFLAAERGIPHDANRHAAYVGSWVEGLKNDKHEIFRAAQDASRATEFLLALEREKSVGKALEAVGSRSNRGGLDGSAEPGNEPAANSRQVNRNRSREITSGVAALDDSLAEAKAISGRSLGDNVRVYNAQTGSGIYRGEIIGETAYHIVQKLSHQSTVAHPKDLLGTVPSVGQNVVLRYSNGKIADMAPFEPKAKTKSLAR